jgi:hypothetical protein
MPEFAPTQHYYKGMEDQLGALGLVLKCVVLWTTRYQDAALAKLRAAGSSSPKPAMVKQGQRPHLGHQSAI